MTIVAIGLDVSLRTTGVASDVFTGVWSCKITHDARLDWYRKQLRALLDAHDRLPDVVAIEGYSYASQNTHAHSIGEIGGVIRLVLRDYRVPVVVIPPASMKLYATGKGNADKDRVLSAAVLHAGRAMSNDEADAWWLRAMALDYYGAPLVKVPAKQHAALTAIVRATKTRPAHPAIAWPKLAAAPNRQASTVGP